MRQRTWRAKAGLIIAAAIEEGIANGMTLVEMKRLISSRYPFHERAMHPYKIWCNEVNTQLELYLSGKSCIDKVKTIKPLAGQKELL